MANTLMDWHTARNATVAERLEFYSIPEPNSGCLLWLAACNAAGYGLCGISRRSVLAHRLAWEAAHGPIPDGLHVLHKCDVPSCVNVDHLWLGSHQDNMADKFHKGRAKGGKGERARHAKLTAADVLAIRADPRGIVETAKAFGIGKSNVDYIRRRVTWRHI